MECAGKLRRDLGYGVGARARGIVPVRRSRRGPP
jgi:hypothetical protein